MSFKVNQLFETTAFRNTVRAAVAGLVGSLVAWGTTKWASLNTSSLSYLVPVFSTVYFGLVHLLEKKYPKLGWLLGLLPKATPIVLTPVVTPAPVPSTPVVTPTPTPTSSPKEDAPVAEETVKDDKKTTPKKK